ncbi:Hypothetical protein KVN_LOCUS386 [uncultured virus]|nr:Hypothetical protein KVN_LOCUS386 [uncultured virus]
MKTLYSICFDFIFENFDILKNKFNFLPKFVRFELNKKKYLNDLINYVLTSSNFNKLSYLNLDQPNPKYEQSILLNNYSDEHIKLINLIENSGEYAFKKQSNFYSCHNSLEYDHILTDTYYFLTNFDTLNYKIIKLVREKFMYNYFDVKGMLLQKTKSEYYKVCDFEISSNLKKLIRWINTCPFIDGKVSL